MAELEPLKELLTTTDTSYGNIRRILFRYNLRVKNSNVPIFDQKNQSSLANFRNLLGGLFSSNGDNQEYLGIVLEFQENKVYKLLNKIYVEVPGVDIEAKPSTPDEVGITKIDVNPIINSLKQRIFYPIDRTALDIPNRGAVVRVRLASNYLNNSTNPHDNKYIGQLGITTDPANDIGPAQTEEQIKLRKQRAAQELYNVDTATNTSLPKPDEVFDLPFRGNYELTSVIGTRQIASGTPNHFALDVGTPVGTEVYTPAECVVDKVETQVNSECGKYIKLAYPAEGPVKYYFVYCHLSEIYGIVKPKQKIGPAVAIGKSGDTGTNQPPPHLHFEIKNSAGERLRPQFILTGQIGVSRSIQDKYGYPAIITMPEKPQVAEKKEISSKEGVLQLTVGGTNIAATEVEAAASPPNPDSTTQSNPVSRPKMRLIKLQTDYPKSVRDTRLFGWNEIKIREDIYSDAQQIKDILNNFGIPLACNYIDSRVDNKSISLFARVGLQIELNSKAGLQQTSNYRTDDYFIGPDHNKPVGNGYALKVYGRCTQINEVVGGKYKAIFEPIDIYSVKETINIDSPKILKIQMPVIDITAIFADFGFRQLRPRHAFFKFSDVEAAHWNVFYKPSKINKGYTYRELLQTVYEIDRNSIWNAEELVWDGERFI